MRRHFWRKAWRFRELFVILAWRDITVRFKQTVIGFGWAFLKPLLMMTALTFIFGKLGKFPAPEGAPYTILVFAGLLPWNLFSVVVGEAGNSLIVNAELIRKVYFPRILMPGATVLVGFVDFLLSFFILCLLMVYFGYYPGWRIVFLPFFIVLALLCGLGPGLWFAALNVKYRDLRNLLPFVLQIGMYVSPIGFSSSVVPQKWQLLYSLNPIVGIVEGFRWCLLRGQGALDWQRLLLSIAVTGIIFWLGLLRFRQTERTFADLI